jgi:hypothetical protein
MYISHFRCSTFPFHELSAVWSSNLYYQSILLTIGMSKTNSRRSFKQNIHQNWDDTEGTSMVLERSHANSDGVQIQGAFHIKNKTNQPTNNKKKTINSLHFSKWLLLHPLLNEWHHSVSETTILEATCHNTPFPTTSSLAQFCFSLKFSWWKLVLK